ncbi:MAG TPA: hypothetical protein VK284_05785 [Streptosporangiaceae bacterium]|nr:hypothetical protein [Streptosporangiaceae bacterium]
MADARQGETWIGWQHSSIARSEGGTFKVVKNLGHIDPKEGEVGL